MDTEFRDFARSRALAGDAGFAIAYALIDIADRQRELGHAVDRLGLGGVASQMGATGYLVEHVTRSMDNLAETLEQVLAPD